MPTQFRHGDVFLEAVSRLPSTAKARDVVGDLILAYGEVTGHAHRIRASYGVSLWDADGQRYIEVPDDGALLSHEEHHTITLPAGCYRVVQQREYSPEEIRTVAD